MGIILTAKYVIGFILIIFGLYLCVRVITYAYFNSKLWFTKQINNNKKETRQNGKA